jgi:outer membrane protein insertion porin family
LIGATALLVLALTAVPAQVPAPAALPPVVEAVEYDCDGPVARDEVSRLIEIRAGDRLDPDAVRRSIQNLFLTERFTDIRVETPADGDGVDVVFHLFAAYRIDPLRFEKSPVPAEELRRAVGLREGSPYDERQVAEGVDHLKRLLSTEGYSDARVDPIVDFDRRQFDARVVYRIIRGPRTLIARPIFDGSTAPFSEDQLIAQTALKPGKRYREEKARRDAERIQTYLFKKGRLRADVRLIGVQVEAQRASPVYRVEVGPLVTFDTRGVTQKRVVADLRALLKNRVFEEDLLVEYVDTLRRQYQEKGNREAKVDYSIERSAGAERVTLTVAPGPKEWIEKIEIDGEKAFQEKKLRKLLLTRERSLLRRGRLVDEVLEEDRRAIEGFYRTRGYTQAEVAPPKLAPGRVPGALRVTLAVTEGVRTLVDLVTIEGASHSRPGELGKMLAVRVGHPLEIQSVDDDRSTLTTFYRERGWTRASVEPRVELTPDRAKATVVYRVTEGDREFFGRTIIRGNTRTRSDRMRISFRWKEGDALSESRMLETQRELTRTGVFQKVDVHEAPPDAGRPERNVLVEVTEGRPLSLLYGIGYQYEETTGDQSPFGILGVGYNNLFGTMRSVSLESRYAPLTGRGRVFLNFREPFFLGRDLPVTATLFYAREPIQKLDIRRAGAFVEASDQVSRRLRVGARLEFQRIRVGSDNPLDIEKLESFDRSIAETTVGLTALYDRRDDPIDPHRGEFVSGFVKDAFPVSLLSADAKYVKTYAQASAYAPLLGGVLAASIRAGVIRTPGGCLRNDCIPIAERFFAGGRTSGRAFDTNIEGIPGRTVDYSVIETAARSGKPGNCRDAIDPSNTLDCDFGPRIVGGSAIAGWNAEWRFPIAGNFGGTLFYDAIQVWDDARIRLRVEGADGLRQDVGLGLRYLTPVGPLRLEYGRVLRPRTFEVPVLLYDPVTKAVTDTGRRVRQSEGTYKIYLSIGYPF